MNNQVFMEQYPPLTEKEVVKMIQDHNESCLQMLKEEEFQVSMLKSEGDISMELYFTEKELSEIEVDGGVMFSVERLRYLQSEEHAEMYKDASQFEKDLIRDEFQWEQSNVLNAGPRILFLNGKIEGLLCQKNSI